MESLIGYRESLIGRAGDGQQQRASHWPLRTSKQMERLEDEISRTLQPKQRKCLPFVGKLTSNSNGYRLWLPGMTSKIDDPQVLKA